MFLYYIITTFPLNIQNFTKKIAILSFLIIVHNSFAEPKDIVFVGLSQPNSYEASRAEVFRQHLETQFEQLEAVSVFRQLVFRDAMSCIYLDSSSR